MEDGYSGPAAGSPIPVGGSPPPGTRLYVVGDIHGRLDLLLRLQRLILDDAAAAPAQRRVVVYGGDYVDRGPESKEVIEHLIERPLKQFESVHLRGNHEAEMLRFVEGREPRMHWLGFGGLETLESYGVKLAFGRTAKQLQRALDAALPAKHARFLRQLFAFHVEGDIVAVHAGIRPGVPLEQQAEEDLLWIRDPFLQSDAAFGKLVVHGHTITQRPEIRPNRIGVDTGAFRSGRLTAAVLQDGQVQFLQT
jgi:serine/threonine protein phosphatase 1